MILKGSHFLDLPLSKGKRKKVIKNFLHYRFPLEGKTKANDKNEWRESRSKGSITPTSILNWTGKIDTLYASLDSPLQVFIGDTTDIDNTALYGCRLAEEPNTWINWKAFKPVKGIKEKPLYENGNLIGAIWQNLWKNADLEVRHAIHKIVKTIKIHNKDAPTRYGFTVKIAPGHTLELINNSYLLLRNENGEVKLKTENIWATDSSITALTPTGKRYLHCSIEEGGSTTVETKKNKTINKIKLFYLIIDEEDFNTATFPIELDPTTNINGTTDIEDVCITNDGTDNNNYGSYATNFIGSYGAPTYGVLYRLATAALPEGTVTLFRHRIKTGNNPTDTGNLIYKAVKPANDWVEGTGTGAAAQAGSCCWNFAKYNTQAWAGGTGLSVDGTDTYTEASYVSSDTFPTAVGTAEYLFDLPVSWAMKWKREIWVNNGFYMAPIVPGRTLSAGYSHRSTESGTGEDRPYFYIEYEEIVPINRVYFKRLF